MKKVLVIFRGLNVRYRKPEHAGMGTPYFNSNGEQHYINPLLGVDNWQAAIFDDLKANSIEYDVAFVTYPSDVLADLTEKIQPKYVTTEGYGNQLDNMREVANLMERVADQYDRFIIIRFDFEYRMRITKWPKWNSQGITLVNRDVSWDSTKLYADILFVVDKTHLSAWRSAINYMHSYPHDIGKYLYENQIELNLMYDDYYNMVDHPLHSYISWEPSPNLDEPYTPIIIK
jgi:hypothetical protein